MFAQTIQSIIWVQTLDSGYLGQWSPTLRNCGPSEFCEGHLDGVEVGRVRRQIASRLQTPSIFLRSKYLETTRSLRSKLIGNVRPSWLRCWCSILPMSRDF